MKFLAAAALASVAVGHTEHHVNRIISGVVGPNMTEYLAYKEKVLAMDAALKQQQDQGGIISMPGPVMAVNMQKDIPSGGVAPEQHMLGEDGHGVQQQHILGEDGHGVQQHMLGEDGHGVQQHMLGEDGHGVQQHMLGEDGHGVQQATMVTVKSEMLSMRQEEYGTPRGLPRWLPVGSRLMDYDYENPMANFNQKCNPDEVLIQIANVAGFMCVPECTLGQFCTAPLPPTMNNQTVQARCALEAPTGASYCALVCDPYQDGCPTGASCKMVAFTGFCTYDN